MCKHTVDSINTDWLVPAILKYNLENKPQHCQRHIFAEAGISNPLYFFIIFGPPILGGLVAGVGPTYKIWSAVVLY